MAEEKSPSKIKRFITLRCLGYSHDVKRTHWEHVVKLESGETKTLYSTDTTDNKGFTSTGSLTEVVPLIEVPNA